ncbi:hypothetical protein CVT24_013360 [Panaeolus cyanescens]|uniref:Kinetochore protein Spc24 n=1 Tax=Panaeolus cyanescens TaxID=181874 RepID=A0A409WAH2_9AGAR|nr:hypothetical protein CVT24_013360 [Panaeolus cyanescens]
MIDVQEAAKLIRDMLPIMDPDEDYLTIVSAEESIAASEARRKKELEAAHANLKALTRVLEAARNSSTRPASVPSEAAHIAMVNELDSSRMALFKEISEKEALLASKESELSALKDEARRLEVYDPAAEHEKELDGTMLRLALYKGLGFEPILDKHGKLQKMLVRSTSGDIRTVDLTTGKSDFDYAQELWQVANS